MKLRISVEYGEKDMGLDVWTCEYFRISPNHVLPINMDSVSHQIHEPRPIPTS